MEHQLSLFKHTTSSTTIKKKDPPPPKKIVHSHQWKLFIDGASRGNPGPSGAGIYVTYNDTEKIKKGIFLGTRTNNQAEYLALALGLFFLKDKLKETDTVVITSDSELLVQQMKGVYKIKDKTLQQLKRLIDTFLENITCTFEHVLRINNKKADVLANEGIDKKTHAPKAFLELLSLYTS